MFHVHPVLACNPLVDTWHRHCIVFALPHKEVLSRVIIIHRSVESRLIALNVLFSLDVILYLSKTLRKDELSVGETWT